MGGTTTPALELRDIHLPEPISWWPLAPGWWFLIAFIVLVIIGVLLFRQYQKKQVLKKTIKAEFENICAQHQKDNNALQLVQSLSILLRRACISFYPRSEVAGLTGKEWLSFLDSTMKAANTTITFTGEHGQLIATAPYLADNTELEIDTEKLIQLCENWLRAQPNKTIQGTGRKP
ncbi:MAG: DUF4381 domain-containing protein [Gammaproteobacteria bacterium]|nr:DUF4381 domain-containing protein [Gammaproteobacteria bacterium]